MKNIGLYLLLFLFTGSSLAQEIRFAGGALLGGNGIQIDGDLEEKWGAGGWTAGLFVKSFLAKKWSIQFELKYIQKGSIHPYGNSYGIPDHEVLKLHYVELPVMVNFSLSKKLHYPFLQAGLAYAYMFDKSYSKTRMQYATNPDYIDQYKDSDYSWLIGVGYRFSKGLLKNFSALFRYSRSIVSIHEYLKQYNVVYGIAIYYHFPFIN